MRAQFSVGTLLRNYDRILWSCSALAGLVLAVVLVLLFANVTARYFFSYSLGWVEEVTQFLLLWLVCLGTIRLLDKWALFFTEILLMAVSNRLFRRAIFVINAMLLLALFWIVFWAGLEYLQRTRRLELDYLDIKRFWFYLAIPAWAFLSFLVMLKKLILMEDPEV